MRDNVIKSRFLRLTILVFLSLAPGCFFSSATQQSPPQEEELWPSWAPDNQRLVYECYLDGPVDRPDSIDCLIEGGGTCLSFYTPEAADLCISDVNKHDRVRLTDDPGGDWHPAWSPDGSQIAYLRDDGIYLITPEGHNRRQLVSIVSSRLKLRWWPIQQGIVTWSPEGDRLLFSGCLDYQDHDVYLVNVSTGTLTNLTSHSRMHDFAPMWTMDGSKIVFLATDSLSPYECSPEENALPEMKVVNADGSGERVVYTPEFYYPYWQVSVSNSGQIVFVTNMTAQTKSDHGWFERWGLYRIDLATGTITEEIAAEKDRDGRIGLPFWSPNEAYVAYSSDLSDLKIFNVRTGEILELLKGLSLGDRFVWSPDSQKIAVTVVTVDDRARDSIEHIHVYDIQSRTFQPLIQK